MDLYDFGSPFAQTYTEQCPDCGRTVAASTQKDEHPEYLTTVYIRCECGASIPFSFPVN